MEAQSCTRLKKKYSIGYALSSEKQAVTITSSLVSITSAQSIDLIQLDPSIPIASQCDDIHLIFHKVYSDEWIDNLKGFANDNPSVVVIDHPELIGRTQNRVSMVEIVSKLETSWNSQSMSNVQVQSHNPCTFGSPKQITIPNTASLTGSTMLSNIKFPLIAKPFASDGTAASHQMSLIYDHTGLSKQTPPFVLQEFVNHGGVVFKVYVIGDYVKCVKRKSLPDISTHVMQENSQEGFISFSKISQYGFDDEAELPTECFVKKLAQGLRREMGLNLFNFDMIRDMRLGSHYLVVDINFFPGYEKLPGFEKVFGDFLLGMVHKEDENGYNCEERKKILCCEFGDKEAGNLV